MKSWRLILLRNVIVKHYGFFPKVQSLFYSVSRFVESLCTWARFCPFQETWNDARLEFPQLSSNEAQFGLRVTLRWLGFGNSLKPMQVMLYWRRNDSNINFEGTAWTLQFLLLKQFLKLLICICWRRVKPACVRRAQIPSSVLPDLQAVTHPPVLC